MSLGEIDFWPRDLEMIPAGTRALENLGQTNRQTNHNPLTS